MRLSNTKQVYALLVLWVALSTGIGAQSRYGGRIPSPTAVPPKLLLGDSQGNPIALTLSGEGHARGLFSGTDTYPYGTGVAGILHTKVDVSRSFSLIYDLDIRQPSLSDGTHQAQTVGGRLAAVSMYEGTGDSIIAKAITRVGNLNKQTLGQGMTIQDLESDGIQLTLTPSGMSHTELQLLYLTKGYSNTDKIAGLVVRDPKGERGLYVVSRLSPTAGFDAHGTLWGLFGKWPLHGFQLAYEAGLATHPMRQAGFAGMLSPRWHMDSQNTIAAISGTLRAYTASYMSAFNHNLSTDEGAFVKRYYTLLEEEEAYDNWRNLLLDQFSTGSDVTSLGAQIQLDQRLTGPLWWFSHAEWHQAYYTTHTAQHRFLTAGFKWVYSPDHCIYVGIRNKLLNLSPEDTESTNKPVLQQVPVVGVFGMIYRF